MRRILPVLLVLAIGGTCLAAQKPVARKGAKPPLPICTAKTPIGAACEWRGVDMLGLEPPSGAPSEPLRLTEVVSATPAADPDGFPSEFSVPARDIGAAWGRAQSFVAQHANMKMQTVSDYVIETYNPRELGYYGFRIVKTPQRDGSFLIKVTCLAKSIELLQVMSRVGAAASLDAKVHSDAAAAGHIEKVAAYYIANGTMPRDGGS